MQNLSPSWPKSIKWTATWQNQQSDCAPSEDSDQPGHPPSLIRVFAVRMKKAWVHSNTLSAQRRLWSDLRMPRRIWVVAGRTLILFVLSCRGSCVYWIIFRSLDDCFVCLNTSSLKARSIWSKNKTASFVKSHRRTIFGEGCVLEKTKN